MKKRFYTIGSLICAGIIAALGFGSCKSGKALQAERTRLTTQADSLQGRLSQLQQEIAIVQKRIQNMQDEMYQTMYGGPNMTEAERREMQRRAQERENAVREAMKGEQQHMQRLEVERDNTANTFNEVMGKLNQLK